jgi:hypothetical protein
MPSFENGSVFLEAGQLSAILLISDTEIARLARRGILPRQANPERHGRYLYPLAECAAAYIRHLKSAAQKDHDAFWKAKAAGERERVRKLTLENDTRTGHLLDASSVEVQQRELAIAIRSRLALIPLRLADRLGTNGNHLEVERGAEAEINAALLELAEIGS